MAQRVGICPETHRGLARCIGSPHISPQQGVEEEGEDPSLPQGSALLSLSKVGSLTVSLPLGASGFPQVLSFHTLKRGLIRFFT